MLCFGESSVTVELVINNKCVRAILDSGASRSVIDRGTLEMLGIEDLLVPCHTFGLHDASETRMRLAGRW